MRAADIASVVGTDHDIGRRTSVIVGWPHPDGDAGQAGERFDAPDDLRRPILAFEQIEPRREVGDAQLGAARVGHDRLDDRRVAHVARLGLDQARDHNIAEALLFVVSEESREHRIGIEVGEAPPHDTGVAVDQRGRATVADQRQVKVLPFCLLRRVHVCLLRRVHAPSPRPANSASQSRTACGSGKAPIAPGRNRPTE